MNGSPQRPHPGILALAAQADTIIQQASVLGQMGVLVPAESMLFAVQRVLAHMVAPLPIDVVLPPEIAKLREAAIAADKAIRETLERKVILSDAILPKMRS